MAFNNWDVEADETFTADADPAISGLKRKAGAAVMQDISLHTYWANTMGAPALHGASYQLYLQELRENMSGLMATKMSYREMEEFMTVLGYESTAIRETFQKMTGIDPVKMDYARSEDVKNTPANIPAYNLAWGAAKKGNGESYFIMPGAAGLFTVYHQVSDMERKEVGCFVAHREAVEYMKPLVKSVHRYDMPVAEQVVEFSAPYKDESTRPQYQVYANHFYDLQQQGRLDSDWAVKAVKDAVFSGTLTPDEGEYLVSNYITAAPSPETSHPSFTPDHDHASPKETPNLDYRQRTDNVMDEVERTTPQDFFESVLPDRMDTITPQHVKDVLSYIAHRGKDMSEFELKLHSLEYMKHETPKALVETNPDTGRPSGPPRATVSVIIEIQDRTLPAEHGRKFALAVFFVNPDGDIGTSDSVKGEDDIIYGFSEDGLRQYFSRDRMVRGQA